MFGKKVIFTSWTRQKNNQSETGQNNLFWDNLFSTCQPSDWLKTPGDPGKIICSRAHSDAYSIVSNILSCGGGDVDPAKNDMEISVVRWFSNRRLLNVHLLALHPS